MSGVNSLDGGDYIFYVDSPYVDYAGISMGTSTEPAFDTGTFEGFSYLNWWTPDGFTMSAQPHRTSAACTHIRRAWLWTSFTSVRVQR